MCGNGLFPLLADGNICVVTYSRGYKVTVLEARERIGGRVHTTLDLGPDFNVELGAQWIHGVKSNPLAALAAKNGLPLSYDAGEQVFYRSDGRPWSLKEESAGHGFVENMLDEVAKKAERLVCSCHGVYGALVVRKGLNTTD